MQSSAQQDSDRPNPSPRTEAQADLLARSVDDLLLSTRASTVLDRLEVSTLGDLVHFTRKELATTWRGCGRHTVDEIVRALARFDLRLLEPPEDVVGPDRRERRSVTPQDVDACATAVSELDIPHHTVKVLWENGIRTVGVLVQRSQPELMELRGLGARSIRVVEACLGELGLELRMQVSDTVRQLLDGPDKVRRVTIEDDIATLLLRLAPRSGPNPNRPQVFREARAASSGIGPPAASAAAARPRRSEASRTPVCAGSDRSDR